MTPLRSDPCTLSTVVLLIGCLAWLLALWFAALIVFAALARLRVDAAAGGDVAADWRKLVLVAIWGTFHSPAAIVATVGSLRGVIAWGRHERSPLGRIGFLINLLYVALCGLAVLGGLAWSRLLR